MSENEFEGKDLSEIFTGFQTMLSELKTSMEELKTSVNGLSEKVNGLETEVNTGKETVEELKGKLETIPTGGGEPKVLYALPGGETVSDKEAFLERARKDWDLGREHQK